MDFSNKQVNYTASQKIYSLGEIAASLKSVIDKTYKQSYWIKSEIGSLNDKAPNGHCYIKLAQKKHGHTIAKMQATIWHNNYVQIKTKFQTATNQVLSIGMNVLFRARVNYHPVHGLSLNIIDVDPAFTLGEMFRERNETINRLQDEGVYSKNKELSFPLIPQRVAVISGKTSMGYSDFVNIIDKESQRYKVYYQLFQVSLQGDQAVTSMKSQLNNVLRMVENFDIVVIIRGGSDQIGLNCFDDYSLARKVALFPIPVVTGIGHSTNETVTEMVAHQNKITPTDVAYHILEKFQDLSSRIKENKKKIITSIETILLNEKRRFSETIRIFKSSTKALIRENNYFIRENIQSLLQHVSIYNSNQLETLFNISSNLKFAASELMQNQETELLGSTQKLQNAVSSFVNNQRIAIFEALACLKYKPNEIIRKETEVLNNKTRSIKAGLNTELNNEKNRINQLSNKTTLLDPKNVLQRGYSITLYKGQPVKEAQILNPGSTIKTKLYSGALSSVIKNIEAKDGDQN